MPMSIVICWNGLSTVSWKLLKEIRLQTFKWWIFVWDWPKSEDILTNEVQEAFWNGSMLEWLVHCFLCRINLWARGPRAPGPAWGKEERKGGKEGKERKEKVAQRHQMVSGSLALLYFLLGFHGGRQGSGPNRGRSPVEWVDFLFVRPFIRPFVHLSVRLPSPLWAI